MLQALLNKQQTITVTSADETMGTATSNVSRCGRGGTVILTATPNDGYLFDSWSDGNTTATRGVVVYEPVNLTANFKQAETSNYLKFTNTNATSACTLTLHVPSGGSPFSHLYYKKSGETSWTELYNKGSYYQILFETSIEIKGLATRALSSASTSTYFEVTTLCNVSGRLTSLLINSDEEITLEELPITNLAYLFCKLFSFQGGVALNSVKDLILPEFGNTFLTTHPEAIATYYLFFSRQSRIAESPVIPDCSTAGEVAYNYLFQYCSNLKTIYSNITVADERITNWLQGGSEAGDFYNLGGATFSTGASGIPAGWTVHTSLDE